ncbi:L-asparaginase [Clupea harengus]|uniref:L-asparaginase n=1 Tax=Clupea harengus TaxID=7950 RepID=A0A8M1KPN2_CLUHA|nr:L-asparaginase [Clupea harengus]
MGNISERFSNRNLHDDQYMFLSAIASSLSLGWLGTHEKAREVKVCQLALFPMLLNTAALQGDIVTLRTHIEQGADVTIPDNRGRTPLHLAAAESDCQTVRYLISKGSEINARDNAGETAIFDAVRCKNLEVVKFLYQEGAVLERSESDLGADMCCLAYLGDTEQMEAWKSAGVSFNLADIDGRTPLHVVHLNTFLIADVSVGDSFSPLLCSCVSLSLP